jgi:hypothetical protein
MQLDKGGELNKMMKEKIVVVQDELFDTYIVRNDGSKNYFEYSTLDYYFDLQVSEPNYKEMIQAKDREISRNAWESGRNRPKN